MKLPSIDPATGELIETFDEIADSDLEAALARAQQIWRHYRGTTFAARAEWLRKAARILESEKDNWARLMTREMSKTYKAAVAPKPKSAPGPAATFRKTASDFWPTRLSRPTRTRATCATCRSGQSSP